MPAEFCPSKLFRLLSVVSFSAVTFLALINGGFAGQPRVLRELTAQESEQLPPAPRQSTGVKCRYLVLPFLSVRCPCSQAHEPALTALSKEFSRKGFCFLGVNSNADETSAEFEKHFIHEARLPFPMIEDRDQRLANLFGAFKTPHVFVVSSEANGPRKIFFAGGVDDSRVEGSAKHEYLRSALLALEQGAEIDEPEPRSLGCQIRRK